MGLRPGELLLEDRRILYRNFSGAAGTYNSAGNRNFCVILEHEEAEAMHRDGWTIKHLKPREEEEKPQPYLKVTVKYSENPRSKPPTLVLVSGFGKTSLSEDMLPILDWADIEKADLHLRPYNWTVRGDTGRSAYLVSAYLTIREDPLEEKYREVPDSGRAAIMMRPDLEPAGVIRASSEILSITRGEDETPF